MWQQCSEKPNLQALGAVVAGLTRGKFSAEAFFATTFEGLCEPYFTLFATVGMRMNAVESKPKKSNITRVFISTVLFNYMTRITYHLSSHQNLSVRAGAPFLRFV